MVLAKDWPTTRRRNYPHSMAWKIENQYSPGQNHCSIENGCQGSNWKGGKEIGTRKRNDWFPGITCIPNYSLDISFIEIGFFYSQSFAATIFDSRSCCLEFDFLDFKNDLLCLSSHMLFFDQSFLICNAVCLEICKSHVELYDQCFWIISSFGYNICSSAHVFCCSNYSWIDEFI